MRPRVIATSACVLVLAGASVVGVAAYGDSGHHARDLLRAPLAGSLVDDDPIAGVPPGGAPWQTDPSKVRVRDNGRLRATVNGLIIPGVGTATVTTLSASIVCGGTVEDTTAPVPLSGTGDARIDEKLTIPDRCIAPVVLLNPNGIAGVFIGVSGREAD